MFILETEQLALVQWGCVLQIGNGKRSCRARALAILSASWSRVEVKSSWLATSSAWQWGQRGKCHRRHCRQGQHLTCHQPRQQILLRSNVVDRFGQLAAAFRFASAFGGDRSVLFEILHVFFPYTTNQNISSLIHAPCASCGFYNSTMSEQFTIVVSGSIWYMYVFRKYCSV